MHPSLHPSLQPASKPTSFPSSQPASDPTNQPSQQPSISPSSQPYLRPTSAPSYKAQSYEVVDDRQRRRRVSGYCNNACSGHGLCSKNNNCECYLGIDGEPEWTGADCSLHTCPKDFAWVGSVVGANDLHPWVECSNKGICDRSTGYCNCFTGYDGLACQRSVCPDHCNYRGACFPEKMLADKAGRDYSLPWDAMKIVGCLCDKGFRGPACELQECPSGSDPMNGYGNEQGRDCSGRGTCDYEKGYCTCFTGFYGNKCQYQSLIM
eukprot:gene24957-33456_t